MSVKLYDQLAEASAIGSLFIHTDKAFEYCIKHGIGPQHFHDPTNSRIVKEIFEQAARGKGFDIITVHTALQDVPLRTIEGCVDVTYGCSERKYETLAKFKKLRDFRNACQLGLDSATEPDAVHEITNKVSSELDNITHVGSVDILTPDKCSDSKIAAWENAATNGFVGYPFCIPGINRYLGGIRDGTMCILGGYRGEGKSTLLRQDALHQALRGTPVAFFPLEDPPELVYSMMAGNLAGISVFDMDRGVLSRDKREIIYRAWREKLSALPIYVSPDAVTIDGIERAIVLLSKTKGVKVVYIDHIQRVLPYQKPHSSRNDTLSEYSARIASLCIKYNVAPVIASQFSRDPEKNSRKPRLSDLRDSGSLEQDARQVMLLYYTPEGNHVLEVAKNNNGAQGEVRLRRRAEIQRFEELTEFSK